jgi:hypothetical protein
MVYVTYCKIKKRPSYSIKNTMVFFAKRSLCLNGMEKVCGVPSPLRILKIRDWILIMCSFIIIIH